MNERETEGRKKRKLKMVELSKEILNDVEEFRLKLHKLGEYTIHNTGYFVSKKMDTAAKLTRNAEEAIEEAIFEFGRASLS